MEFIIPYPLKVEHEELHNLLHNATKEPGEIGEAAKTVAKLMHPHFLKEEEYVLPPLGLLRDLAQGKVLSDMEEVLELTDRLKANLSQMLEEHKSIVAALENLSAAAEKANKVEYVEFAKALTLHAQTEEEVSYPTAILIGEYIREKLRLARRFETIRVERDIFQQDWNPKSDTVLRDQRAAYDEMRERCPVAYSELREWSLFRHEDITRVLHNHETFSNSVSEHLSVPNGMDPPEHTTYRRLIEPYFAPERMDAFEPLCREIVITLVQSALASDEVELITDFAQPFAVRVQCAFLGWPAALHEPLIRWIIKNHEATIAQDRQALSELAREFEEFIDDMLETCLQTGAKPEVNVTAALMHERVGGKPLRREEIASLLRNWTVGEIGTISAAIGILVHYLALQTGLQMQLRAEPCVLPAAIDEILRIHGPLVANRRITTRPVEIGGRELGTGERISLNWMAANRDGRVFDAPDTFRLDRDATKNLLYGAGIHVCPGAPLARMELRVVMEELLKHTTVIGLAPDKSPTNSSYPASGFSALPLKIQWALYPK